MKTLKLIVCFMLWLSYAYAQGQYENGYNQTYWNYRDKFKKFYTHLGTKTGESLPIGAFMNNYGLGNYNVPGVGSGSCDGYNAFSIGADDMATQNHSK